LKLDVPIPDYEFLTDYWMDLAYANLIISMWLIIFFLTYNSSSDVKYFIAKIFPKLNDKPKFFLAIVILVLTLISISLTGGLISSAGSFELFMLNAKISKEYAGLYIFRELSTFLAIISLINFISTRNKIYLLTLLINLTIIYLWGIRTPIGLILVSYIITYHFKVKKLPLIKAVSIICILIVLFQGLRAVREIMVSEALDNDVTTFNTMSPVRNATLSLHMSEYDGLVLAMRDVGVRFEYRYGEDFFNGLTSWIPRFIWTDKPGTFHVGKWFRQVYESEKENGWPISPLGAWYVNFNLLGILMGATLTGVIVRAIDYRYQNGNITAVYTSVVLTLFLVGVGVNTGFIQAYVLLVMPLHIFGVKYFFKPQ
jgi:oligosaccharide repeat unit polymerase